MAERNGIMPRHKTYLTDDGKKALLTVGALAAATCGTVAFLVKPRQRDWQNTAQWKNFERYRYAHRGLFDEPVSAQAYPKGTKGDPFRGAVDTSMTAREQVARVKDKVTKNPDAPVATPLWAEDVKDYPTLVPENSLPAFRAAAEAGYGTELDVHLTKDNVLVVVHDSDLERLCGRAGFVEELTHEELCSYRLLGTQEQIPTLEQVLPLFEPDPVSKRRHPPVLVDVKTTVGNCADITRLTLLALDRFDIDYVIESFDPRVLLYLRRHRPDVMRGQLSRDYLRSGQTAPTDVPAQFALSSLFCNVIGRPDFVAYKFADRHNPFVGIACGLLGGHLVTWTVRSDADLAESEKAGSPAIFEYIRPDPRSRLSK